MRDPGRIDPMLAAIRDVWMQYPDMRLGQLLSVATQFKDLPVDLFSIEDSILLRKVEGYPKLVRAAEVAEKRKAH